MLFKGGIINAWKKKSAVALDLQFFQTLPTLDEVEKSKAEIAWFVYDLVLDVTCNRYVLTRVKTVYTRFIDTLRQITVAKPGLVKDFVQVLQEKLDEKLDSSTPPTNMTLEDLL